MTCGFPVPHHPVGGLGGATVGWSELEGSLSLGHLGGNDGNICLRPGEAICFDYCCRHYFPGD